MSGTFNFQSVTTNQTIQRPILSSTIFSTSTTASKQSQPQIKPINKLVGRNSISPKMSRSSTARDSFPSSNENRLHRTESPVQMTRSGSNNSRTSTESRRRYDNTVYHYGRHSNYWLFGGFSVRDTVRDGVDWLRQQKKG
ncbi:uncharacterized protein BDV17DRAFT_251521 [Aspergillus undulatus]|uniref:uncharacterized protein n=1 Tax=Aspergillus undulatus TaxID=1810928 RepID=UPI003CCCA283